LTCIRRAPYSEERHHDGERGYRELEKYKFRAFSAPTSEAHPFSSTIGRPQLCSQLR